MTTWEMTVLVGPRHGEVAMQRRILAVSPALHEADDVVGDAPAVVALRWPGFDLLRVLSCVPLERGGVVYPRRAR